MNLTKTLKSLCAPSKVYLAISVIGILALLFDTSMVEQQHFAQQISLFNIVFILFWTYILDMICKSGYTGISWFFVLLPYIMFLFVIFASFKF